jgi:hypothetical protein
MTCASCVKHMLNVLMHQFGCRAGSNPSSASIGSTNLPSIAFASSRSSHSDPPIPCHQRGCGIWNIRGRCTTSIATCSINANHWRQAVSTNAMNRSDALVVATNTLATLLLPMRLCCLLSGSAKSRQLCDSASSRRPTCPVRVQMPESRFAKHCS